MPNLTEGRTKVRPRGKDHRALNKVFKFPHVSGPVPVDKRCHRFGGNLIDGPVHFGRVLFCEVAGQNGYVFGTVS
jgi:hypothetical protein